MEPLSRLAALPARPPTPPKEAGMSSDGPDLDQIHVAAVKVTQPTLDTPNESPCSVAEPSSKTSDRPCKRVDFQLGGSKLATVETSSPHDDGSARSQPSSRNSRPVKSILKPSAPVSCSSLESTQEARDFPRMLDDFARQLAAPSASSRLDAYMQLNNCLKTYKNMPEQKALREKMPLLVTFVERDLQETEIGEGARSTQLATEVVRLVTTLLWSPTMADVLPEPFQCFILDKSIAIAGSEGIPKALVNQYLHLLAVQNFRSKVMNTERANRLISNLSNVTEFVKGKQVVAHKLEIYKKMISQARNVMHARFRDWYECLFHGLLAPNQEIRVRALSLAHEAGMEFGTSEHVTKAVMNLFNHKVESRDSKMRYGELFIARFQERLAVKEERQQVPQLWAAVLLFLRHKSRPLERWSFTSEWLRIMQQCLNIGDMDLRLHAIRAWTRWILVVDPGISTSENMAALLRTPVEKQLDRFRLPERETKKLRASVVATYATLLYYAFRPSSSHDVLDRFWSSYVAHFFTPGPQGSLSLDAQTGSMVLSTLIGDDRQKVWNASRVMEPSPIKIDELPRLDPKWIRARASTVLTTLENVLLSEEWWAGEANQTPAFRVWRSFTKALGEASRKEVKVSSETMQAVSEVVSTLVRFFIHTTIRVVPLNTLYQRLAVLIEAAVQNMGYLPFAEQRLLRAAPEKYSVTAAPAGRSHKSTAPQITAFAGLLDAVVSSIGEDGVSEQACDLIELLIQSALKAGSSLNTRLSILRGFCTRLRLPSEEVSLTPARAQVWNICADALKQDFDHVSLPTITDAPTFQLTDLRNVVKIFEVGLDCANVSDWISLFEIVRTYVVRETGSLVCMVCLINPVAETLMLKVQHGLDLALLSIVVKVIYAASPEAARSDYSTPRKDASKALGISIKHGESIDGPIRELVGEALKSLYPISESLPPLSQASLLEAISTLPMVTSRRYLPAQGHHSCLEALQLWLEDPAGILKTETADTTALFRNCVGLWQALTIAIQPFDQLMLDHVDPILVAALGSRHRAIANHAIEWWNRGFGTQTKLEYSHHLQQILARLASTEISAPSLGLYRPVQQPLPTLSYLPTPASLAELDPDGQEVYPNIASSPRLGRVPLMTIGPNESHLATPNRSSKEHKLSPTPRLRHDDSQIQFAAITSSPPNIEALESQLLTEHQREVRDRQQAEARAMFPDLRSSPRRKMQERDVPRLKLRAEGDFPPSNVDDPQSPTLPPPNETPFLGSSPTPSQRVSSRDRTSASSRASIESHLPTLDERDSVPNSASSTKPDISSELQTFGEELLALYEEPIEDLFVLPQLSEQLSSDSDSHFVDAPCRAQTFESATEDAPVDSNLLRFDSARELQGQQELQHEHQQQQEQSLAEMHSPMHVERADAVSDEKKEITAQILNDIERATSMSQDTSSQPDDKRISVTSANKRKRDHVGEARGTNKRRRSRGISATVRPPMALSEPDDDMEDCIVVACSQSSQSSYRSRAQPDSIDLAAPRSTKSPSEEKPSHNPSSEPVWDVPSTPELKRKSLGRKRRSRELAIDAASHTETASNRDAAAEAPDSEGQVVVVEKTVSEPIALEPLVEMSFDQGLEAAFDTLAASIGSQTPKSSPGGSGAAPMQPVSPEECGVPSPATSTPRQPTIAGADFLARVRRLAEEAKHVVLGGHGDEIMAGLMDVGREVMEAKRRP